MPLPPLLKRFSSLLCLLVLLSFITGALVMRLPQNTVTLPLEVLGPEGYTTSITVYVDDPATADSLYIKGHALGYTFAPDAPGGLDYDDKASFRLNGGAWVPIDNAHFNAFYPEQRMWSPPLTGPIGGPYHTLRGMLSLSETGALVSGANTLEFRFNGTEGHTSGYRILELDVRASRSAPSRISGTQFVQADPAAWQAPVGYGSAADVAAGEALWHERGILHDGTLHQDAIEAACADCHANNGRDLKYFNFSNKSITVRAQHHGLTEEQGKQLAAYIRSVDLNLPAGEDVGTCGGRPWNPPYQPGPGLEERPVDCWAAGAGVDWTLPNDEAMAAFLFPNSSTRAALDNLATVPESYAAFRDDLGGALGADLSWSAFQRNARADAALPNARLPLAMQLPTIYEWWPDVYPGDYFDAAAWHNSQTYQNLNRIHMHLSSAGNRAALIDETHAYRNDWKHRGFGDFFRTHSIQPNPKDWPDDLPPPGYDSNPNDPRTEIGRLSTQQWAAIKTWEIMTTYRLEDLTEETLEPNNRALDLANWDRMWPLMGMMPYDVATHKQGERNGSYPDIAPYPTAAQDNYFSNSWYQLAVMLQNGVRQAPGTSSVDWNYVFAHIDNQQENYDYPQFWRYVQNLVTQMQTRASWGRDENWQTYGWSWRNNASWKSLKESTPVKYFYLYGFNETRVPQHQRVQIGENLLQAWHTESARYDVQHWATLYDAEGGFAVGPNTHFDVTTDCGDTHIDPNGGDFGHDLMKALHVLQCNGSSSSVLNSVATWAENILPGGNWERFMTDGDEGDGGDDTDGDEDGDGDEGNEPSVTLAGLSGKAKRDAALIEWHTTSEHENRGFYIERQNTSGTWTAASPLIEGAGTTDAPQQYTYRVDSLSVGEHLFRLRQVTHGGSTHVFADRTINVDISLTKPFEIKGVYPNPFHQQAIVEFVVREGQTVTATLYNALGQRVQVLHDGPVPANEPLKLTVRAGNLASGVYFVRFRGKDFQATHKLALVR